MKTDITGRELMSGDHIILTNFWKGSGIYFGRVTGEANGYLQARYPFHRDIRDTNRYVLKVRRSDYLAQFAILDEKIEEMNQQEEERRQRFRNEG